MMGTQFPKKKLSIQQFASQMKKKCPEWYDDIYFIVCRYDIIVILLILTRAHASIKSRDSTIPIFSLIQYN